jgi:ubiquinone biosynthesis protein
MGLSVNQTNFSELLNIVIRTLKKHRIYLPREWYIIFRALMTLDGVGKSLGIDFNIFGILENNIAEILENSLNKDEIIEEAIWGLRDMTSTMRIFPRHFRWFMRDFARKGYAFHIKNTGYEKELNNLSGSLVFLGFACVAGILFYAGVTLFTGHEVRSWTEIPTLTWIFWSISLLLFSTGIGSVKK